MNDRHYVQFFLQPRDTFHRRYEALRAIFVEGEALPAVAERFGYKVAALRSMASRFRADCRRGVSPPFFAPTAEDGLPDRGTPKCGTAPRPRMAPTVGK